MGYQMLKQSRITISTLTNAHKKGRGTYCIEHTISSEDLAKRAGAALRICNGVSTTLLDSIDDGALRKLIDAFHYNQITSLLDIPGFEKDHGNIELPKKKGKFNPYTLSTFFLALSVIVLLFKLDAKEAKILTLQEQYAGCRYISEPPTSKDMQ